MKIIHTADWHLGNTFHGHDRHDEQAYFLDHLVDLLKDEQPDALLIAGDVFDTSNPSAAAEKLFFDFLSHATAEVDGLQIVVVAGNHDSAARLEAPSAMLSTHRVFVRGTVQRLPSGEVNYARHLIPLRQRSNDRVGALCLAVPFLRACDYPAGLAPAEGVTHFFRHLREAGIGSLSEIFDGDPPHRPDGCIAQAWSVAECQRLLVMLQQTAPECYARWERELPQGE